MLQICKMALWAFTSLLPLYVVPLWTRFSQRQPSSQRFWENLWFTIKNLIFQTSDFLLICLDIYFLLYVCYHSGIILAYTILINQLISVSRYTHLQLFRKTLKRMDLRSHSAGRPAGHHRQLPFLLWLQCNFSFWNKIQLFSAGWVATWHLTMLIGTLSGPLPIWSM